MKSREDVERALVAVRGTPAVSAAMRERLVGAESALEWALGIESENASAIDNVLGGHYRDLANALEQIFSEEP